jgi:hypothetical protein
MRCEREELIDCGAQHSCPANLLLPSPSLHYNQFPLAHLNTKAITEMFCSRCGSQNPDNGISCIACGQLLPSGTSNPSQSQPDSAAAPAPARSPLPPEPEPKAMHWFAGFSIAVVVVLSIICRLVIPLSASQDSEQVGYIFGETLSSFFLPTLIAWVLAGRRSQRNPNRFAAIIPLLNSITSICDPLAVVASLE